MADKKEEFEARDRYRFASDKPRRAIFFDNLIGGLAWGVGSIIGATIIIGVLGLLIRSSRQIPLLGDVVQVVIQEIESGRSIDILTPGD